MVATAGTIAGVTPNRRAGVGGGRADRGHRRMREQVGHLLLAVERGEAAHRGGAREGHHVDAILQQLAVNVDLGVVLGGQGAERRCVPDVGTGRGQRLAERVAAGGGRRHQHAAAGETLAAAHCGDDPLHPLALGGQFHANAEAGELGTGPDAGGANPRAGERPDVAAPIHQPVHEAVHAVHGGEHDPVALRRRVEREIERLEVVELGHAQHRRLDGFGARGLEQLNQLRRLVA